MKYVLLIYQPDQFDPKSLSREEHQEIAAQYGAISSSPGVTPGDPLGRPQDATTVRVRDGQIVTAAGPYVDVARAVGGFFLVEAESLDDAVAMAARIPAARLGGGVEVRPCKVYW